tara:strand:+ start:2385 stop:2558 length:174 start_codon:yes stop_codon:yes gene_type:complete
MIIPSLFIEVISDNDKVKVEQRSCERHRDLETKDKEKQMRNLNKRLKKMKSKNVKKK